MSYFSDDEARSRQIILEHYEEPDNKIENQDSLEGYVSFNNKSSSCIDNLTIHLKFEGNKIIDAKFSGIGCAISTASTDIFCSMIKNMSKSDVKSLIDEYFMMVDGNVFNENKLQHLSIFKNISKQLNRIKCAKVGVVAINELVANKLC